MCGDAKVKIKSILIHLKEPDFFFFFFFFLVFLGPHLRHMVVPRLGVESELQPPAYTTATAMQDPSCVCDLHHSSRPRWILNPRSEARDPTNVLTGTTWVPNPLRHNGNSTTYYLNRINFFLSYLINSNLSQSSWRWRIIPGR